MTPADEPPDGDSPSRGRGTALRIAGILVGAAVLTGGTLAVVARVNDEPPRTVEGFCAQIAEVDDFDELLEQVETTELEAALARMEELQQVAPEEIATDVGILVDFLDALVEQLAGATSGDTGAIEDALRTLQDRVVEVEAAGRQVESYTFTTCQVDLNVDATTTSAPATTAVDTTQLTN